MIKLTRFDGSEIIVNEDFIEMVEQAPDTVVSFQNGHRIMVKENVNEILDKCREYQRIKFNGRK
ncbi:MAG: flagellar protein FlbD [Clostridiales bacterium]|jgi:flagellar protein FlbD|nr:flagellar FlbD family protein [Oscillospiraceae bacterium]MDN5377849.1 flagellar protein FlbD [Clostridiales bacterium]